MSHPQIRKDQALTALGHAIHVDEEESKHREERIKREQTETGEGRGSDSLLAGNEQTKLVDKQAHFSEKVYMFPEEFNALRRELEENWQYFFTSVNPELGFSPAWAMVFNAPAFVGMCNGALDMVVQFDSEAVAKTCKTFLNGFRKMRGISAL